MTKLPGLALLLLIGLGACRKESAEPATGTAAANEPAPSAVEAARAPAPVEAAVGDAAAPAAVTVDEAKVTRDILASYEAMRASLAADQTEGIAEEARRIDGLASPAAAAGGPRSAAFHAMAAAARRFADADSKDIEKHRLLFGELSKPLVEHLAAAPELAAGQHVFQCPMAAGYQKWVQPGEKIENPYMGKKMLACGSKTQWK